jgi:plasmid stability protein
MPTYLLRDVPDDIWRAAKGRAAIEGRSMRDVLLNALHNYAMAGAQAKQLNNRRKATKVR